MKEYTNPVNFIDLVSQQKAIKDKLDIAISKVLSHGKYIMGPEVGNFEDDLKKFAKTNYSVACANGTDAITLVLMACGVKENDAVFVPSFTYVATAESVSLLGATPFFIDVKEDTFNLDSNSFYTAINDAKKMGLNPKAVIPVDLFGQPSELEQIINIAKDSNIFVLSDAAQSFGAKYKSKMATEYADATTTSFFPAKPLGCYGDGGAILTNNKELAEDLNSIRLHGRGQDKYEHVRVGMNSRLDTIQAAILIEKLKIFAKEIKERNILAKYYNEHLNNSYIKPIIDDKLFISTWAQYTLQSDNRDQVMKELNKAEIPSAIYYPLSLKSQEAFKHCPEASSGLKNSELLSKRVFSIPMHAYMLDEDKERIVHTLNNLS